VSKEFRRLLEDRAGSHVHSVLEAGLRDRPSPAQLTQAARALGIGAAGLGAAQSAAAAAGAVRAQATLVASVVKWGATGLLLGGAALSPFLGDSSRSPVPQAHSARAITSSRVATQVLVVPTPAASQARAAPVAKSASPVLSAASARRAARSSTRNLEAEVALLDAARSALKLGNAQLALSWLDRHAALRAPFLEAEATLLRVQCLVAAGRSAEARRVVEAVDGRPSGSAYSQRLRNLVRPAAEP